MTKRARDLLWKRSFGNFSPESTESDWKKFTAIELPLMAFRSSVKKGTTCHKSQRSSRKKQCQLAVNITVTSHQKSNYSCLWCLGLSICNYSPAGILGLCLSSMSLFKTMGSEAKNVPNFRK